MYFHFYRKTMHINHCAIKKTLKLTQESCIKMHQYNLNCCCALFVLQSDRLQIYLFERITANNEWTFIEVLLNNR